MQKKDNKYFQWDDVSVEKFWSNVANSSTSDLSFGKSMSLHIVQLIKTIKSAPCTVLDFGGGDGDLTKALLDEGYSVAVYEPASGREDKILSKDFAKQKNFLGVITPESAKQQFDIVCCFEVLEHILPHRFEKDLQTIKNFITPHSDEGVGGVLIASVPYNENLDEQLCICPQCETHFHRWQHVRSFDANSLKQLFTLDYSFVHVMQLHFSNLLIAHLDKNFDEKTCMHNLNMEIEKINEKLQNNAFLQKTVEDQKNKLDSYIEEEIILDKFCVQYFHVRVLHALLKRFVKYHKKNLPS